LGRHAREARVWVHTRGTRGSGDVTGAGDTVIAIVTLGLCAGTNLFDAARLANYGAGIVVRKWGNAILQPDELRAALRE